MAGIKRFIKNSNIKTRVVSILVTVTILAGSLIWFGNNNAGEVAASEGTTKDYMVYILDRIRSGLQENFTVLEIVPYDGMGEFRYYMGVDEVTEKLEAQQDLIKDWYWSGEAWQQIMGDFTSFGYEMRYNSGTGLYEIRSNKAFINNVLGDYAGILYDRLELNTVEANKLKAEDIENADLIVFTTQPHDATLNVYKTWSGKEDKIFYTSTGEVSSDEYYDSYEKIVVDGVEQLVPLDASWEMCQKLLDCTVTGRTLQLTDGSYVTVETPMIFDTSQTDELGNDGNLWKFGLLYRIINNAEKEEQETFTEAYVLYEAIKPYLSTSYTNGDGVVTDYKTDIGDMTTVALDTSATGNFDENSKTVWTQEAIVEFYKNYQGGKYKNDMPTINVYQQIYQDWLTDNCFSYRGTSLMIPAYMSTPSTSVGGYKGVADRAGSPTSTEGILQYLLGIKDRQVTYEYNMKVLEVQPCNSFDYDTFEEVLALGKKLLMSGTNSWTVDNYRNYLDVDCVTTNALNGMTDDLIAEYDMIIIGENIELLTKDSNGETIYNDRNLNGYIYLAYGDLFKIGTNYLGILPEEYQELVNPDRAQWFTPVCEEKSYLYSDYVYNSFVNNGGTGKVYVHKNMYEYYKLGGAYGKYSYDSYTGELYLDYSLGNVRGADNDITDVTKAKLMEYAKSGKPIVLSDSLYELDSTKVYPTSDIYNYAETLATENEDGHRIYSVVRQKYVSGIILHLEDEVPVITMQEKPLEPAYVNGVVTQFGSRNLKYRFNISGQTGKTYRVKLYVDKNNDGVFKGIEEGVSDDRNELYYSEKVTLTGGNTVDYIIESRLSDNFVGILSWKIVVVQLDDGGNETALATSVNGYSAIKNEEAKPIRVLQILPQQNVTLNMSINDPDKSNDFQDLLSAIEGAVGYDITIDAIEADEFEAWYAPDAVGDNSYTKGVDINTENDKLRSYDMVVIGFSDMYGSDDITNLYGALDNIIDFMDIGKAVLFTHDTISWRSTPNHVTSTLDGNWEVEMWNTYTLDAWGNQKAGRTENFAYELTMMLRDRVGLDKYGITRDADDRAGKDVPIYENASSAPNYATADEEGKYYVNELHGFNTWNIYRGNFLNHFVTEYDYSRRGLNCIIPYTNTECFSQSLWTTTQVMQLNEGPVTMYPYAIDEKLTVAKTHAQYFELDMEDEDIVVWYTLSDDGTAAGGYYECTEKDAGNNYYIYSKNNITYSGAGHSNMSSEMELRLFVNTIVKAIAGGNNEPELMVTNGAVGAGGVYMVYENSANSSEEYHLDIKATDADLISYEAAAGNIELVGDFKAAYVYWVKPDGTEQLIKSYTDANPLKNGIVDELYLSETSLTGAQLDEIENLVEETDGGYAQFRIEVYDWLGAKDEVTARIVERNLFELE